MVLTDDARQGTLEQRSFVSLALATPDFAFLEGPPGSGKTTAICELILQVVSQGKRVLLCGSTHVAVDNVLERLMDDRNPNHDLVIPIRIGDRRNVSDKARAWQFENFVETEHERLLRKLCELPVRSESQQALFEALRHDATTIERMVLDAANLVCGTTIGVLQHPDIKPKNKKANTGGAAASFDMLIVDEASKTTFQEFLVPAMHAKRWVIVGDPKQLSPYVDDEAMAVSIEACLPNEVVRNVCIDVFSASATCLPKRRRVAAVVVDTPDARKAYLEQAKAREVMLVDVDGIEDDDNISHASLVIGSMESMQCREYDLPLDVATVRPVDKLPRLRRRADAWLRMEKRKNEELPTWASEVAWRLSSEYDQRFGKEDAAVVGNRSGQSTRERLRREVEDLLPVVETGADPNKVRDEIQSVRRVALPSVLESLRYGFGKDSKARKGSALTDGFPEAALSKRHVLLTTQHRMHPDIAQFSHEHIYDRKALNTPSCMTTERAWSFARHAHRAVWIDVAGGARGNVLEGFNRRFNSNPREADVVVEELRRFDVWAATNRTEDGRPWEAAALTFYRGQEREVRMRLRRWTEQHSAMRYFVREPLGRRYLTIEVCTVDRFQGHEADFVIISFANDHPTSFLESPNRLNVALTRARYQRILVGNREAMKRARGSVLCELVEREHWDRRLWDGQPGNKSFGGGVR